MAALRTPAEADVRIGGIRKKWRQVLTFANVSEGILTHIDLRPCEIANRDGYCSAKAERNSPHHALPTKLEK
jgi:hypothetical protein